MNALKKLIYQWISKQFMNGCSSYNSLEVRKSCRSKKQARTVFGEGKVAQFTTESYPYYGFFLAMGGFVSFIFAILFKRKALKG